MSRSDRGKSLSTPNYLEIDVRWSTNICSIIIWEFRGHIIDFYSSSICQDSPIGDVSSIEVFSRLLDFLETVDIFWGWSLSIRVDIGGLYPPFWPYVFIMGLLGVYAAEFPCEWPDLSVWVWIFLKVFGIMKPIFWLSLLGIHFSICFKSPFLLLELDMGLL